MLTLKTKNKKIQPVHNNEFEKHYKDIDLRKKMRNVINKTYNKFHENELENIIVDSMIRGMSYFKDGYNTTIHTNIIKYLKYGMSNANRNYKTKIRKEERIKQYYTINKSYEYTINNIDLLLDIDCLPETSKKVAICLLSGYSKTETKEILEIGDNKLKIALSSIAKCILNR